MAASGKKKKKPGLSLDPDAPARPDAALKAHLAGEEEENAEAGIKGSDSFYAGADHFEAGDLRVDEQGLHIGDNESAGSTIPFEKLEEIRDLGAGACSTVKLVRHRDTDEYFALKSIGLYMKNMRDMLLSELRALFHSDCEALISFYGATYREGSVAVILEFMDLGGLDNVVRKSSEQKIPERVLAHMTFQILWGLGYLAHERRVHRDVKPQNILVNSHGEVKLTDFGISKELSTAVLAKTFVGSFKYMSPERMATMPYDYSSDIWSLGLVLLEALTGQYPYPESSSTIGYVSIVMDGEVPIPPKDGTHSDNFVEFTKMCLQKDPSERASAVDLLESDWLAEHGAIDLETCQEAVRDWLISEGMAKDDTGEEEEVKEYSGKEF
eukprot:gb/GECG01010076.1/.p1 GENE.gb/GECG01010076.1/~~gb/GECG01010076.1/.p1  ORF type:complete len:383 (+),score=55.95 gb/GECG01010076.1/:1-1149(+)